MKKMNINKLSAVSTKLFGHDEIFKDFLNLYENNNLPKVIILTGEKGSGKFSFAFHFINFALSQNSNLSYDLKNYEINKENNIYKKIVLNVNQNFNYLSCEKPYSISVDDIREIKRSFSKTTLNESPRFTIIDDIELLNLNAANSLLKLIEEPSDYDYFILINNKKKKMIETIFSRSIEFKFFLSFQKKKNIYNSIKKYLNIDNNFIDNYLNLSSPGNLIEFSNILSELEIDNLKDFDNTIFQLLVNFKKNKRSSYLNLVYFLIDIKFQEIVYKKTHSYFKIVDNKNKIFNLIDEYYKLNLNMIGVYNQFQLYLNNVR